jgi:hypothetical protein
MAVKPFYTVDRVAIMAGLQVKTEHDGDGEVMSQVDNRPGYFVVYLPAQDMVGHYRPDQMTTAGVKQTSNICTREELLDTTLSDMALFCSQQAELWKEREFDNKELKRYALMHQAKGRKEMCEIIIESLRRRMEGI